ncbi:ATP-binding protein [Desulforapulum autotrophicum]|uniref:ATP-binding protein n=1 Tax=Desulforapulum autotrophicum TaxID=2296 RepID=UPI000318134C|nr:ATP-binding protein [Desulforapulum autotrophicum]
MSIFLANIGVTHFKKIILAWVVLILTSSAALSADLPNKNILILHSFHKGHTWDDSISKGIDETLASQKNLEMDTNIYYEYMDVERVQGSVHILSLYEFFRKKYAQIRFDVIIATDDSAFRFLMDYQKKLFPKTPVVFCGVNYFEEFEMFGYEQFTGVVERIDIIQTVETALGLHPKTRELLVVVDRTDTSIAIIKTFIRNFKHFRDPTMFHFIGAQTSEELRQRLAALQPGTVVLFVNFTVDKTGKKISMGDGFKKIIQDCPVPVYSFWDSYLGNGVLGGKMSSGSAHGRMAAKIALRILNGELASTIPIFKESLNRHMFDYKLMQRFNIPKEKLPSGTQLVNIPFSFYATYKKLVLSVVASIAGLSLVILALVVNTFKRKRVEKTLNYYTNQLNLLHRIDRAILAGKFSHEITWEVLQHVRDLNACRWASVVLFDFKKQTATLAEVNSDSGVRALTSSSFPISEFNPGILNQGRRVTVNCKNLSASSFVALTFPDDRINHFTCIPLISNGKLIGSLNLSEATRSYPHMVEIDIFEEVAASLAVAIQSVNLQKSEKRYHRDLERLSAKVFEMQEATCRKISFELHDEIGQALTAANINLAAIKKLILPDPQQRLPGLVNDTQAIINRLTEQAHDLSLNLWPPMLRDFGLESTIQWYLRRIGEKVNIQLIFDGSDFPERPAQEIETTLYRLVQEALNNVLKHAQATRVDISITQKQNGMIFFMVEDNGQGFDLETTLSDETMNDRLGILGMRERIAILGGKLDIWSSLDKGTCVSAEIPWQERK